MAQARMSPCTTATTRNAERAMTRSDQPTVAFLGTGTMGAPMARNLLNAGVPVRVWNRTRTRAATLADDGAVVADSPAEAGRGADVLVTMLIDGNATVDAVREASEHLPEGTPWLQMGTIGLAGLGAVADLAHQRRLQLVDAPVLGTRGPAERGALIVLAAGPRSLRDRVQPLFDVVGERTQWLGENAAQGAGTRVKLVVNNWVLALTNAVGESVALAEALHVNPQDFLDAIKGTATDSPYAHVKGSAILQRDFAPDFTVSGAHKDAELIREAAGEGLLLDVADAVRERFRRAVERDHAEDDMAAAYFSSFPERS